MGSLSQSPRTSTRTPGSKAVFLVPGTGGSGERTRHKIGSEKQEADEENPSECRGLDICSNHLSETHPDEGRHDTKYTALSEFLPEVLKEFLAAHPGIDIDLEENASYGIVKSVAEGFVEIGIVADIVDFADLEAYPFATDRLVVVMPRTHPAAGQRSVAFRSVLDCEFVGLAATNALQQHIGQQAARAGKPLKLRVRLGSFDAACRMVGNGIGLAVMPETAARRCRRTAPIHMSRLTDPWALRRLHVCVRRSSSLPQPARLLLDHLREYGQNQRRPATRSRHNRADDSAQTAARRSREAADP